MSKSRLNKEQCEQVVLNYFQKQQKYKSITGQFDNMKKKFYSIMEEYFQANDIDEFNLTVESEQDVETSITVKRIQNSSVIFNAEKLKKVLSKEISETVISTKAEINDLGGLISYLKECGVDPKIFKSFLTVHRNVDVGELENLEAIGKITAEQIKGCYTVKAKDPYFKVSSGKVKGGND